MFSTLLLSIALFSSVKMTPESRSWKNWCGMEECQTKTHYTPSSEEELIQIVREALSSGKKIKAIGSGHSLNAIARPEENEWSLSLEKYKKLIHIDPVNQTVTVESGMTLKELNEILYQNGMALENLGSTSDQTVGGVFQTGTHGTGKKYGSLHTQILSLTLVNGNGELQSVDPERTSVLFRACQCGLGTLGIVSTVTLKTVPARFLQEENYPCPFPQALDQMNEWIDNNDYVRLFWFPYLDQVGVWTANWTDSSEERDYTPPKNFSYSEWLQTASVESGKTIRSFDDFLELGPTDPEIIRKYNRVFFNADFNVPRSRTGRSDAVFSILCGPFEFALCGAVEIAVPMDSAKPFLLDLAKSIRKNHFPAHVHIEIRFVKGDQALLSPVYSEEPEALFCYVNIISVLPNGKSVPYEPFFKKFQKISQKYQGRPHWGKMGIFNPPHLKKIYPQWEAFTKVREEQDPQGIFLNDFTNKLFKTNRIEKIKREKEQLDFHSFKSLLPKRERVSKFVRDR